jgi:hypothetical protein
MPDCACANCGWQLFLSMLLFLVPVSARAAVGPPVEGRPQDFSGAVGKYRIEAHAEPKTLRVEDPLLLTLTIKGSAAGGQPPRRPNLHSVAGFDEHFQVEDLPEKDDRPDPRTWRFVYRLRPRTTRTQKIPRLPFVYFNPAGTYETSYTAAIPLQVKSRPQASHIKRWQGSAAALGQEFTLIRGESVLKRDAQDDLPGPGVIALFAVLPPLGCLVWFQLWRRWYPDAARAATLRRSRASRHALRALRNLSRAAAPAELGARAAAVLGRYLRQRLDVPAEELTPFEVSAHLKQAGVSETLAGRFADLWDACDAARFAPDFALTRNELVDRAARLISQLEAEPCWSRASS